MQFFYGTLELVGLGMRAFRRADATHSSQQKICRNDRALTAQKTHCDKPSPVRRVMLHLRACYVSKAAILTNPVLLVPVENRSPV